MKTRLRIITLTALFLALFSLNATALTVKQFSDVCNSTTKECSQHPALQAYVGGALDLLAVLDEQTDYLDKVYCKKSKELFDVPGILRFMSQRSNQNDADNAMLLLIHYFEEKGGCTNE